MAVISTKTITLRLGGILRQIVYYVGLAFPNTILAFISDNIGIVESISYQQGDLVIVMTGHPQNIDYEINQNGELIVHGPNADNYSFNSDGYLIYTY